jgi:hypothetical protein
MPVFTGMTKWPMDTHLFSVSATSKIRSPPTKPSICFVGSDLALGGEMGLRCGRLVWVDLALIVIP